MRKVRLGKLGDWWRPLCHLETERILQVIYFKAYCRAVLHMHHGRRDLWHVYSICMVHLQCSSKSLFNTLNTFWGFTSFPTKYQVEFYCKTPNNQAKTNEGSLEYRVGNIFHCSPFFSDPYREEYFVSWDRLGCVTITNNSKSQWLDTAQVHLSLTKCVQSGSAEGLLCSKQIWVPGPIGALPSCDGTIWKTWPLWPL